MTQTLLVTGCSGLVGSEVFSYFPRELGYTPHRVANNQRAVFLRPQGDTGWNQHRVASFLVRILFGHGLNDPTNAFNASRRTPVGGGRPLLAPQSNVTAKIPLKAIVRGYSLTTTPIFSHTPSYGVTRLKTQEISSRYFLICAYVWLERYFSRGDHRRRG
jgi:hypothetical protein